MNRSLGSYIRKISWAYLILLFDFNLSIGGFRVNLTPDWIGGWMIYSTLMPLSKYEESTKLLKPLQLMIILYDIMLWVLTFMNQPFDFYLVKVIFSIINLYLHFQIITNIVSIAKKNGYSNHQTLLNLRTFKVIGVTLLSLPIRITLSWEFNLITILSLIYLLIIVIIEFRIIRQLFKYASYEERREAMVLVETL